MFRKMSAILLMVMLSATAVEAKATVDYDPDADFGAYRSFAFPEPPAGKRPPGPRPPAYRPPGHRPGSHRLDNPLMHQRIRAAVKGELAIEGYEFVPPGAADLLVVVRTGFEREWRVGSAGFYAPPRRWRWGHWTGSIHAYPYRQDYLVVDLIDRWSKQLVWRGWVEVSLDNPEKAEKRIRKAVGKLFDKYPP